MVIAASQFLYPSSRLLPFATIDGKSMGAWTKADAITDLNQSYDGMTVGLHFGGGGEAYYSPKLSELGIKADNTLRIAQLQYPWYLRIIPTSVLWAHLLVHPVAPAYERDQATLLAYIDQTFGGDCQIPARDATLKAVEATLEVVTAQEGGTCQIDELTTRLSKATPTLDNPRIDIPVSGIQPQIGNEVAQALADSILSHVSRTVDMKVGNITQSITRTEFLSWLDFPVIDGTLTVTVNIDRASAYLNEKVAPSLAIAAGTTTISTYDYAETSRQTGPDGQALDVTATVEQMQKLVKGELSSIEAVAKTTPATVVYNRSYSATDTGLAALMQNYAQTHQGVYGISLVELSGKRRHAAYRGNVQFTTASTYKLFVAYSTLRRVESGAWQWSDQIHGGRDLAKCFDDMIVLSDNECAHALLDKIGFREITSEARAIGAVNTSFLGNDGIKSTAEDEAVLLSLLYSNQILNQQTSRDRWVNALKRNIYRQGIPRGVPSAVVANKVGFLEGLLHDAAIVYAPTGNYVLVILTEGSSWANIAELTREIEALRSR